MGAKFDFKDARCVVPCLELLRELAGTEENVGWPVFLNADVWMGPGGNPPKIAPADFFLACFDIYPAGTLSPGWTCWLKFDGPSDAASRLLDPMLLEGYNLQHVEDALRTLPRGVGHVTFPVHGTMDTHTHTHTFINTHTHSHTHSHTHRYIAPWPGWGGTRYCDFWRPMIASL